jgi:hypothetical protein
MIKPLPDDVPIRARNWPERDPTGVEQAKPESSK